MMFVECHQPEVMTPHKVQQACLWSWRLLQVQKGMMLHLHSWFKHSAFDVRTTGCWKGAIFTENQELYAFLCFLEMEQKHSASERFKPEDLLRWPVATLWIETHRWWLSTRRGVWFAARRLKMSGDIGGNWAMPGHSNPEKKSRN